MGRRVNNLVGKTTGLLTVTNFAGIDDRTGYARWLCKCQCGNVRIVPAPRIVNKTTQSCGCIRNPWDEARYKRRTELYGGPQEQLEILLWVDKWAREQKAKRFMAQMERDAAAYRAENPDDFGPDPGQEPVAVTPEPQTAAPESGGGYVKIVTITPWRG